jgi:AbrB family looped-hinge helix DNA binding protein
MLLAIDKRGSINLPAAVRRDLGLENGTYLDLEIGDGGTIHLHPVSVHRTIRLNEAGIKKLEEARKSGKGELPKWLSKEMKDACADSKQEVS